MLMILLVCMICTKFKTLIIKLVNCKDPFNDEFSALCNKNIFEALRKGVNYRVTEGPYNLRYFKDIYFSIADKKEEIWPKVVQ